MSQSHALGIRNVLISWALERKSATDLFISEFLETFSGTSATGHRVKQNIGRGAMGLTWYSNSYLL